MSKKINPLRLASALKKFGEQIKAAPDGAKKLLTDADYTADEAKQIIEAANAAPAEKAEVKKPAEKAAKPTGSLVVMYHPEKDSYHYCTRMQRNAALEHPNLEQGWEELSEGHTEDEALAAIESHKAEVKKEKEKAAKKAAKADQ